MSLTIHDPQPRIDRPISPLLLPHIPQLNLLHAGVHGNKARKLLTLAERGLDGALPPVVASHGGVQVCGPVMNALDRYLSPTSKSTPRSFLSLPLLPVP